jgi:hypothetical protein
LLLAPRAARVRAQFSSTAFGVILGLADAPSSRVINTV